MSSSLHVADVHSPPRPAAEKEPSKQPGPAPRPHLSAASPAVPPPVLPRGRHPTARPSASEARPPLRCHPLWPRTDAPGFAREDPAL